jgi:hypothetical protein
MKNIENLEDYQNLVDWYYENEYSEKTLHEDLYDLPLIVTANVHIIIENNYSSKKHFTTTSREVKKEITHFQKNFPRHGGRDRP